jgi:1-deoxy-D-xylulose-5-phosphate synthase
VGIAEQHAVTSAAGMAMGGLHPVVAIYSTFLNRAFDQLLMDVALHHQPVTLILDRAGITGPDGASHHGMWDLSILGLVPGIRVAAPRDADTLRTELREAVDVEDGPSALRFPRGGVIESVPAVDRVGSVDVLRAGGGAKDVLLIAVGAFGALGVAAGDRLADEGVDATVVDPRWVIPVPSELVELAAEHRLVATVEDSGRHGGFGWAMAAALRDAGLDVPLVDLAVPQRFIEPGTREEVLSAVGLTASDVVDGVLARLGPLAAKPGLRLAGDRRAELA